MAQPNLGTKRVCVSCSARFYDLNKNPAVCPKCGTEQPVELPRVRRPVEPAAPDSAKKAAPDDLDSDTDLDTDADADADDVMEDEVGIDDDDDDDISSADIDLKTDKEDHDN